MTVFILMCCDCESYETFVHAVFSDREKAEAYMEKNGFSTDSHDGDTYYFVKEWHVI